MMTLLDAALRSVHALPPLPGAILELARVIEKPVPEVADVADIVERDPALTAAMLRVASSAGAGARCAVTNVTRAIAQIGPRSAIEVAMSAAFVGYLPRKLPGYNILRDDFINHCVTVGRLADSLCRQLGMRPTGDPFTCGLLHDCGKLVFCHIIEVKRANLKFLDTDGSHWCSAERALLGTDHTVLGEAVARAWGLAPPVGATARWHHTPWLAPTGVDTDLAAVMHIANEHAHAMRGVDRAPAVDACTMLRLDEDTLEELLELATRQCKQKSAA